MDAAALHGLRTFLEEQEDIALAYLFGSQTSGETGPLSDVDVAVSFPQGMGKNRRFSRRLEIIGEVAAIVGSNDVDVVVLNDASTALCFEVLKANHPLVVRDPEERIDFEHRVMSRYLDRRVYEQRAKASFIKKVADHGLGGA